MNKLNATFLHLVRWTRQTARSTRRI